MQRSNDLEVHMKKSIFFLVLLLPATVALAFNQPTELNRIKTVNVVVGDLPEELVANGAQKEILVTTLEDALKTAGLTVLGQGRFSDTVPTVSLRVSALRPPNGRFFALDVVLDLLDNVSSSRTAGMFGAIVWSKDVLQLLGTTDLGRIVEAEKKLVDEFLTDYAQANPR